ncbi:hypothetical protein [uncultured Tenacibaculum sp.]|uniref:hypothetical protein n=1 Tax=uncultured Tenacibaculum sp. TaxID=174713 RepID=UPI00260C6074|nr:hypothetical protein [uncultured Tenacibaculum sp.]
MTLEKYSKELILVLDKLKITPTVKSDINNNIKAHLENNNDYLALEYLLNCISELELEVHSDLKNKIYSLGEFIELDKDDIDELIKPMPRIDLQNKTEAEKGEVLCYWFENKNIGLEKKRYHKIIIPLKTFDSGLDVSQPEETSIISEWISLDRKDPFDLDNLTITTTPEDNTETSVYIGTRYNPCDIKKMKLEKVNDDLYKVTCELFIEFEYEMVAKNEFFKFSTLLELNRNIIEE